MIADLKQWMESAAYLPNVSMKLNRHGRVAMMEHRLNCWLEAQRCNREFLRQGMRCFIWWKVIAAWHQQQGLPLMSTAPENCQ